MTYLKSNKTAAGLAPNVSQLLCGYVMWFYQQLCNHANMKYHVSLTIITPPNYPCEYAQKSFPRMKFVEHL